MSIPNPFRPVCGALGGELPPGFTRVDYIASTVDGGQYIDTGIVANASLIWRLDWAPLVVGPYCSHGSFANYGHVDLNYGGSEGPNFRVTRSGVANSRHKTDEVGTRLAVWCDLVNKRCKFGGDEWQQMESNNIFSTTHITLFGRSKVGEISYLRSSSVYRSTMWLGETLVSDLVPALDRQGRPCLYNVAGTGSVEQNTFYNAGSGEFLYQ